MDGVEQVHIDDATPEQLRTVVAGLQRLLQRVAIQAGGEQLIKLSQAEIIAEDKDAALVAAQRRIAELEGKLGRPNPRNPRK